jgi:hypothetical protein
MQRQPRSPEDLKHALIEQTELLSLACDQYDKGSEIAAKNMAAILRTLLKDGKNSKSLFSQLSMKEKGVYTTAQPIDATNLMSEWKLLAMRFDGSQSCWIPRQLSASKPPCKLTFFEDWWDAPVVKDHLGSLFSRKNIIENVAETDGGVHIDPGLEPSYEKLSRKNSIGWVIESEDGDRALLGSPTLACLRQITHEILITLWLVHNTKPSHSYNY